MQDDTESDIDIVKDVVLTRAIERFREILKIPLLLGEPTILVVIGEPGIGKTTAVDYHIRLLSPRAHSDFPACIKVIVPPLPTPRKLLIAYLDVLKIKPKGENAYEYQLLVVKALQKHDIQLTILDEGNRLTGECLETVRDVFDTSERPIAITSTPKIQRVIEQDELFESRVLYEDFDVLSLDDMIDKFLPQLNIPRWKFDPNNSEDRAMAEFLWSKASPSLRKLMRWIRMAGVKAIGYKRDRITLDEIKASMKNVRLKTKRKGPRQKKGKFEEQSEIRHDGRQPSEDE